MCVCVRVCARARALKIVSMDKILRFINTLLLLLLLLLLRVVHISRVVDISMLCVMRKLVNI